MIKLNLFVPNAPFLCPLKPSENRKVSWRFQGVEKGWIGNEWVKQISKRNAYSDKFIMLYYTFIKNVLNKIFVFKIKDGIAIAWQIPFLKWMGHYI